MRTNNTELENKTMAVDRNLLKPFFSIPAKRIKPQKNSRFKKLEKRAEAKDFILERGCGSMGEYELSSNIHTECGTLVCQNLNEVEQEMFNIEKHC